MQFQLVTDNFPTVSDGLLTKWLLSIFNVHPGQGSAYAPFVFVANRESMSGMPI